MAFIFGVATQEADLYKILRDFLSGAATPGRFTYSGTGTGTLNNLRMNPQSEGAYETYTLTCESIAPRGGTFGVIGSVSGVLPDATVGQVYKTPNIEFYIDFGTVDFQLGDQFVIYTIVGDVTKPRFSNLMGGVDLLDETVTFTCITEETFNPPQQAVFSVVGSTTGPMPDLTQGEWYRNQFLTLFLDAGWENPDNPAEFSKFDVGDSFQIPFTRNPLRRVNQQWRVLRKTVIEDGQQFGQPIPDMDSELILRGPGLAGADSVFWGMTRNWNDSTAAAWWIHYGMGGYIPSMPINEQPLVQGGQSGVRPAHTFWALPVPYTIIASGRCFKVLTRSNIYYSQSYQGLMLPSSMPKYYGYPYYSGGTGLSNDVMWSSLSSDRASFWNPLGGTPTGYVVTDSRTWLGLHGSTWETSSPSNRWPQFWPDVMYPYAHQGLYELRSNLDDTVPLFPVQLSPNRGQLDGVFAIPGRDGRQPEEILVNRDGSRALVVQNHHRSGFNDFCAFTLE